MKAKVVYNRHIKSMYTRCKSRAFSALVSETFSSFQNELGFECLSSFTEGRHKSLLDRGINPSSYDDPFSFRDDYLAVSLLSKYPYLDVEIDREKVALDAFRLAEKQCSETNLRLSKSYVPGITSQYTPESVIFLAQVKIASLLRSFDWNEAEPHFGFGPGSTSSLPKRRGDAYYKFGALKPHVTKACSALGLCAVLRIPRWYDHLAGLSGEDPETLRKSSFDHQIKSLFTIVDGNRVTTVPKNAKTDRVIAIEPDLNMYIQKGIGSLLRSRLRLVGIDLNNQTNNQIYAKVGSETNKLCTIDLSSASDTVSMKLVELLLPDDWVSAIKQCRSPCGILPDGTVLKYHKVSSMGNGFTFELESLIFWALCSSVISLFEPEERRLLVYGDDIIMSSSLFHTVSWILKYCGFTVNIKKSFSDGPFRESCGKHYFKGVDVTPFYIREKIESPDRLIWFANSLRRWSKFSIFGLDGRFYKPYSLAVSLLPSELQHPTIPDGFGDIALWGDFDECKPKWSTRYHCLIAIGVSDVRGTFVPGEYPYLLRQLRSIEARKGDSDGEPSGVVTPNPKRRWRVVKLPVTRWESYGGWLTP